MTRRKQLRQDAALLRDDIDRRARLVHQGIDNLMRKVKALARAPAALPIAFVVGILSERLGLPVIKNAHQSLAGVVGKVKARQIVSGLIDWSMR